jgi:AraC-like DNA-binding protein/mannose-6-phosphate isomerase-like protein (cupin superfamily)
MKIDTGYASTLEALKGINSSINIQNMSSDFGHLFHMESTFQITLEYSNGENLDDYVNIITLSPERSLMFQESLSTKNFTKSKDAPHYHDYYEFVIVLDGTITQIIEGQEYPYSAGSCCLINRSLQHLEHYKAQTKVLYIGMSPSFIMELFDSAKNSTFKTEKDIYQNTLYKFIEADLKNPGKKSYIDFLPTYQNHKNAVYLHSMAEDMITTLLYPEFGASYKIRGLLCSFLAYLSSPRYYHGTTIKLNTNSDFLIFSRVSRLFEESNGRMSRGELEQQLNYSGDYLNRIVNKYSGMCLFDYGMNFCLKKAAQYLTETNESINTIATRLNFSNRTHFYNLFKGKYGVTPKEYRQMHQ